MVIVSPSECNTAIVMSRVTEEEKERMMFH